LELQRFWALLNVHSVELRATFVWLWLGLVGIAPVSMLVVGVLHYTKPSGGVSSACRTLM